MNASASHHFEKELVVLNEFGLYTRTAAEFVLRASAFDSAIYMRVGDARFSAKRVVELLFANLKKGACFILEAEGSDAFQAIESLSLLLEEFAAQDTHPNEDVSLPGRLRDDLFLD